MEQREIEEWRAHHQQQRREGRVRADPVVVRPHGGRRSSSTLTNRKATAHLEPQEAHADSSTHPDNTPRPRRQTGLSTDNESTSSDSTTSTETESARAALGLSTKPNHRPGKTKEKDLDTSTATAPPRKAKGKLPRLRIKDGHFSLRPPGRPEKPQRRRYSFEKGDETLTVTSPTWAPESHHAQPTSPAGDEATAQHEATPFPNGGTPGPGNSSPKSSDGVGTATPAVGSDSGTIKHSPSTNTVRWVGSSSRNGDVCSETGSPRGNKAEDDVTG